MEVVKVIVDAANWMSALQDVTTRASTMLPERMILLRIDTNKGTLTMIDEDAESIYRIILPIQATEAGSVIYCRVPVIKFAPMYHLFRSGQGEISLTCRIPTLSFKLGKKHFHVPNHIVEAPTSEKDNSITFYNRIFDPERVIRFVIPDIEKLLRTLESCEGTAIRVRVGEGVVCVHTAEFVTDYRNTGVYLWPCEAFCNRLSQLPEGVMLHVVADDRSVYLSTSYPPVLQANLLRESAGAVVLREILFKPFPTTTLYISNRDTKKKHGSEENLLWTNASMLTERERRKEKLSSVLKEEQPPDSFFSEGSISDVIGVDMPDSLSPSPIHISTQAENQSLIHISTEAENQSLIHVSNEAEKQLGERASESKESVLEMLEKLPGLTLVKKQVRDIAHFAAFEKKRIEVLGIPMNPLTLHMSFLGNPGTGKTMVARMIGQIFKELGLITKGHVVEVDRQSLVGAYMGHTEANLVKYVKRAMGGILFIDEAYALYKKDSSKDFGLTAINGLVKIMEDHRDNLIVILAGYKKEMYELVSSNPGLRERIPFHIEFPDYTNEELAQIAEYIALKDHYVLTEDAKDALIKQALREKIDETFGNARTVRNLIEKAKIHHAVRAAESEPSEDTYTTLLAADFSEDDLPEEGSLESVLAELDQLVGLEEVKHLVKQIVDVLRLEKKRLKYGFEDEPITFHMAFTGNPGTGKTTVARLMGKILRIMDLLPKGHFVEASRKDLVAGFIGQTALKTAEKIKEALGGILFIDEAYALASRGREDFGLEALTTLIKEMEDKKGHLTVILAGYTKEMEGLFKSNPGLKSRVRFTLHFPDYTASELVEIVTRKALASHYHLSEAAQEKLWRYFIQECLVAGTDFGNGRLAEKIFEHARMHMSTRIGRLQEDVDKEMLITITEEDIVFDP